jgi:cytochrome o ubiquinol oxidase operon protein cyoD
MKIAHQSAGSLTTYLVGFGASVILTLLAYFLVVSGALSGSLLVGALITLALVQLFVQLVFFLHLGRDSRPRWNILIFLFMAVVVLILVFGTLWIMNNLTYHTMTSHEIETYIQEDEGIR